MTRKPGGQAPRERTPLTDAVAEEIRGARDAVGMTQQEVANAAGLGISTYVRMETGQRPPTIGQVERACVALGVRLSDLIAGAEARVSEQRAAEGTPPSTELEPRAARLRGAADLVSSDAEVPSPHELD